MKILSISSQVIYGPVGNSAAGPAMERAGHTVLAVPTAVLSNHPGHTKPAELDVPAEKLAEILDTLQDQGWLDDCGALLTGYFRTAAQVETIANVIADLRRRKPHIHYLCDPVIGDSHTGIYVPEQVANGIRDRLLPLADTITPNIFELAWLSGTTVSNLEQTRKAAKFCRVPAILVTSIPTGEDRLETALVAGTDCWSVSSPRRARAPHGTGDLLSGLYLAEIADGHTGPDALARAVSKLEHVLDRSASGTALDLAAGMAGIEMATPFQVIPHHG